MLGFSSADQEAARRTAVPGRLVFFFFLFFFLTQNTTEREFRHKKHADASVRDFLVDSAHTSVPSHIGTTGAVVTQPGSSAGLRLDLSAPSGKLSERGRTLNQTKGLLPPWVTIKNIHGGGGGPGPMWRRDPFSVRQSSQAPAGQMWRINTSLMRASQKRARIVRVCQQRNTDRCNEDSLAIFQDKTWSRCR